MNEKDSASAEADTGLPRFIDLTFGVSELVFQSALEMSPGSQGSIAGAVSEILLKQLLENDGFEVLRIKEKPSGGNDAKNAEARGDFYIRRQDSDRDEWWVIESKGLKSNSEFRGGKLDSPKKVLKFLESRVFDTGRTLSDVYESGFRRYQKERELWEAKNPGKHFPDFCWDKRFPGAESFDLAGLWSDLRDLKEWVESLDAAKFTEAAYRNRKGAISILETHQPSQRVAPITGKDQAAPLVTDFNVMAVDLFFRTGIHEFVFMNSDEIAHSPTSPEHLYQNYTIDILIPGVKDRPTIQRPWYSNVNSLLETTRPEPRPIDETQIDRRGGD